MKPRKEILKIQKPLFYCTGDYQDCLVYNESRSILDDVVISNEDLEVVFGLNEEGYEAYVKGYIDDKKLLHVLSVAKDQDW